MESKKVHYFKPKMVIDRTKTNDTTAKKQTTIEDSVSNYDTKRTFVDVIVKDRKNSLPPVKYKVVNPPKPDKSHPSHENLEHPSPVTQSVARATRVLDTSRNEGEDNEGNTTKKTKKYMVINPPPSSPTMEPKQKRAKKTKKTIAVKPVIHSEDDDYIAAITHSLSSHGIRTTTRSTQTIDQDFPIEEPEDPPHWSIVSINGRHVDSALFPKFVSVPTLFGVVENPDHFDNPAAANIEENEMFVTWVVSGEASWIDKSVDNVIQCTVERELLTVVEQPPTDLKVTRTRYSIKKDHLKWFKNARRARVFLGGSWKH